MTTEQIILLGFVISAAIGLLIGFVKGFVKVKSWGFEYVATTLCAVLVTKGITELDANLQFALTFGTVIVCFLLFAFLSHRARKYFKKGIEKRQVRSFYEQYRDRLENDEIICDALEDGDEKTYQKHVKISFNEKSGAVGIANRVVGGLALAIKGAVMFGFIAFALLAIIHFAQVDFQVLAQYTGGTDMLSSLYESKTWEFAQTVLFDFVLVTIIGACIKAGFNRGIVSPLWKFVVIALIVGGAILAYYLAFNVTAFTDLATSLVVTFGEGLTNLCDAISQAIPLFTAENVCKSIITVVLFVLLLVPIIFIAAFGPKLIENARDSVIFKTMDGLLGAAFITALVGFIIIFLGAVLYTVSDLAFMERFNDMVQNTSIAKYIYQYNILNEWEFIKNLPIHDWLTAQ